MCKPNVGMDFVLLGLGDVSELEVSEWVSEEQRVRELKEWKLQSEMGSWGIQTVSVFITIVSPKPSVGSGIELMHNRYWEGGRRGRRERRREGKEREGREGGEAEREGGREGEKEGVREEGAEERKSNTRGLVTGMVTDVSGGEDRCT